MNELMEQVNKTPIEIALGIDEEGMTTGKKAVCVLGVRQPQLFKMVQKQHQ